MLKGKKSWIALFSQTGSEIVDIADDLGLWPDVIVTNKRPEDLRTVNPLIYDTQVIEVSNKPTRDELEVIFKKYDNPIITLHGWLRIMPPDICNKYTIYNGHPGLITKYPELKGKDPQVRMMNGNYDTMGCVLHEVTSGVDEGKVLSSKEVSRKGLEEQDIFRILSNISGELWIEFLTNKSKI
tara:strand:- start:288 stop:836 length:549 start_codon:yes stop_codon:yes gene_type:complete